MRPQKSSKSHLTSYTRHHTSHVRTLLIPPPLFALLLNVTQKAQKTQKFLSSEKYLESSLFQDYFVCACAEQYVSYVKSASESLLSRHFTQRNKPPDNFCDIRDFRVRSCNNPLHRFKDVVCVEVYKKSYLLVHQPQVSKKLFRKHLLHFLD